MGVLRNHIIEIARSNENSINENSLNIYAKLKFHGIKLHKFAHVIIYWFRLFTVQHMTSRFPSSVM